MNDLELCKAIAEIEGVEYESNRQGVTGTVEGEEGGWPLVFIPYNPLTDKALLWDLMVKYGVEKRQHKVQSLSLIGIGKNFICANDSEIPRAVLQVIIEAHADDK